MTPQINLDTIVPTRTGNVQGVLGGNDLGMLRQLYADVSYENAQLRQENRRLRVIIERAGLELPELLAVDRWQVEPVEPEPAATSSLELDFESDPEGVPVEKSQPIETSAPDREELEVLKLNLVTATERLDRVESSRGELQAEDEYKRKLMAFDNQVLSGAQKLVFLAVREYIFELWHSTNALGQFVHVPFWAIKKKTGLSTDTIGSSIKRLHEVGLVVRDEQPDEEKKLQGKKQTQVLVALTLLAFSLEVAVDIQKKRGHGGDTRYCKFCNSPHLVKRKRVEIVCKDCNRPQDEPVITEDPVNPADPMEKALQEAEESQREACRRVAEKKKVVESLDVAELDEELAHLSDEDDQEEGVVPDLGLDLEELPQEEGSKTVVQQNSDTVESTGPQVAGRSTDETISVPILSEQSTEPQVTRQSRVVIIDDRPPKPDIDCALCWRDHKKHVCSWVWSSQGGDNGVPGYCCLFCYSSYDATLRELEQRQRLGICEEPILKLKKSKAPYSVEMMRRELLDLAEKCGYPALKWRCEGIVYELDGDEDTYLTRVVMNDLLWMWMAFQVLEQTYGEKKVQVQ